MKIGRRSYVTGFVLSLLLTLTAFLLVWRQVESNNMLFEGTFLLYAIGVLALTQLIVQLIFFLHITSRSEARWNLAVLMFAAVIVLILVFGSLWIMINLNYHHGGHIDPAQLDTKIIEDEGIKHHH
jgi:cytochrome o ubiquinol oxidase operon protein cyoD